MKEVRQRIRSTDLTDVTDGWAICFHKTTFTTNSKLKESLCGLVTSETRFLRRFIVTIDKTHRNRVSSYLSVSHETVATY